MLNAVIDKSHHNTVARFPEVKQNGIERVIHNVTLSKGVVEAHQVPRIGRCDRDKFNSPLESSAKTLDVDSNEL